MIQICKLGCKIGSGEKGFADELIKAVEVPKDVIEKALDINMCCYYIKVLD
ncbi:MAG: hypothetical protein KAJ34_00295 [Thermodesulfovibrionia bacterium]|nr:hypothetical protein [Thermodesulfovibrionia bacterium]